MKPIASGEGDLRFRSRYGSVLKGIRVPVTLREKSENQIGSLSDFTDLPVGNDCRAGVRVKACLWLWAASCPR